MNQRGQVINTQGNPTGGEIDLQMTGSLMAIPNPVSRPFLGSAAQPVQGLTPAGFHYGTQLNDEVISLSEMRGWASGSACVADPANLPTLAPGESQILSTDGRMFYMQNGVGGALGKTFLYSDPSGVQITVDSTQRIVINPVVGVLEIDGNTIVPGDPFSGAVQGLLSLGGAPFDGAGSGHFTGAAGGTVIAMNLTSAYTGDLENLQVNGVSKYKISKAGDLTVAGATILSGTLNVTGLATLAALTATGVVNLGSVSNAVNVAGALNVTGLATLNGGLSTVGITTGTLTVTGSSSLGAATMTGTMTWSSMSLTSAPSIGGTVSGTTCLITWPHGLQVVINGVTRVIPLFT